MLMAPIQRSFLTSKAVMYVVFGEMCSICPKWFISRCCICIHELFSAKVHPVYESVCARPKFRGIIEPDSMRFKRTACIWYETKEMLTIDIVLLTLHALVQDASKYVFQSQDIKYKNKNIDYSCHLYVSKDNNLWLFKQE